MATPVLPSGPVYVLNLPDVNSFTSHFVYRYFTRDETLDETNTNAYVSEDYKDTFGHPRKIVLEFDPVESLAVEDVIGEAFSSADIMPDVLSEENLNKLTSELMLQSSGYTKLTSHGQDVQSWITTSGDGSSVNMIEAFFAGASVSSNTELFTEIAANISVSNQVYLNSSTGIPKTDARDTVSDLALQNFMATDYIHDLVEASAYNPFSPHGEALTKNLNSLKSSQVRQRKIVSPLVCNLNEYNIMVDPINLNVDPLYSDLYAEGIGVIGYIILKYEVTDSDDIPKPAIAITSRTQTVFEDLNVKYGATYRYDLHPLCILRFESADSTAMIPMDHVLLIGTEAQSIQIDAIENIPPSPIEAIQFEWTGYELNLRWAMPAGQVNDSGGPVGDIKGYQIFVRSSTDSPYTLKKTMAFYDGLEPFTSGESFGNTVTNYDYAPTSYTCNIDPDTEYIFAMCTIDAHGNSSNLSPQYSVNLNSYRNELDIGFISFKGAPKQYPNFMMSDKIFLDSLKVSDTNKITVYYNPEYDQVEFDPGNDLPPVYYEVTNYVTPDASGKAEHPSYRLQLINVNTQSDEILDIFLPNS